jgi:hypothetical protein
MDGVMLGQAADELPTAAHDGGDGSLRVAVDPRGPAGEEAHRLEEVAQLLDREARCRERSELGLCRRCGERCLARRAEDDGRTSDEQKLAGDALAVVDVGGVVAVRVGGHAQGQVVAEDGEARVVVLGHVADEVLDGIEVGLAGVDQVLLSSENAKQSSGLLWSR